MKRFFAIVVACLHFTFVPPLRAENQLIPIEHFAADPLFSFLAIAPSGDAVAFLREFGNISYLCTSTIGSDTIHRLKLGEANAYGTRVPREVGAYYWVSDQRLLLVTQVWDRTHGSIAINKDGSGWTGLTGWEAAPEASLMINALEVLSTLGSSENEVIMLDRRDNDGRKRQFPHVIRLDTDSGNFKTVLENPGNISQWILDDTGTVRVGVKKEGSNQLIYRRDAQASWEDIELPGRGREKLRVLGFGKGSSFFVKGFNDADRWSLFRYDLDERRLGEMLLSDALYDTVPEGRMPVYAGIPLASPILSAKDNHLLGMRYITESPRTIWLDDHYSAVQKRVDQALPQTINLYVGASEDESRIVFLSMSDVQPGIYHLLDLKERSLKPIGSRMPWLQPSQLAPMHAVRFEARDGTALHGYLTLPKGREPQNLPTIIVPHGGPWVRDVWGFDPLVQLLASRGYAVVQVNYRGSIGYGSAFRLAGTGEIGGKIQDDVDDAAQWALRTGVADSERMAILGGSYGGYSALFAAGKQPDRYQCAISISGVTDWHAMFNHDSARPEYRQAAEFWKREFGEVALDDAGLKSVSPLHFAAAIKIPVLLIHGKEDKTVPMSQSKQMAKALKQNNTLVRERYFGWEGHFLKQQRSREAAYTEIVEFLAKHL